MKTVIAKGNFVVSFNCDYGDYELGDGYMQSLDYAGDDVEELASEVVAGDPNFPMTFVAVSDPEDAEIGIVGFFYETADFNPEDDNYPVAIMVKRTNWE